MKVTVENAKHFPEKFGKALAEALGLQTKYDGLWHFLLNGSWCGCCYLATDLNLSSRVEKAVIEKLQQIETEKGLPEKHRVGDMYFQKLAFLCVDEKDRLKSINYSMIPRMVTADAATRLSALLLALGIETIED